MGVKYVKISQIFFFEKQRFNTKVIHLEHTTIVSFLETAEHSAKGYGENDSARMKYIYWGSILSDEIKNFKSRSKKAIFLGKRKCISVQSHKKCTLSKAHENCVKNFTDGPDEHLSINLLTLKIYFFQTSLCWWLVFKGRFCPTDF